MNRQKALINFSGKITIHPWLYTKTLTSTNRPRPRLMRRRNPCGHTGVCRIRRDRMTHDATSRRLCFALDLVDDLELIEEYRRMHQPGAVWPAVIDHIRAQGIEAMEIWHRGDRLFMIIEAADDFPRPAAAGPMAADNSAWERLMDRFQKRLTDASPGEKWSPLDRIFVLAEHKGTCEPT